MTQAQAPDAFELVSIGSPQFARLVAQSLRREGLADISWEPPEERCGVSNVDALIVVYVFRGH